MIQSVNGSEDGGVIDNIADVQTQAVLLVRMQSQPAAEHVKTTGSILVLASSAREKSFSTFGCSRASVTGVMIYLATYIFMNVGTLRGNVCF